MPTRSDVRVIDRARVSGSYWEGHSNYDVLRVESSGWRMNGAVRPYSELNEHVGDRPSIVEIAHEVEAAQFMPLLEQIYVQRGANAALIVAIGD